MIDPGLSGKVALVTGANHGIGAATARALVAQGAAEFLSYLRLRPQRVDGGDPGMPGPARYFAAQAQTAVEVVERIREGGGRVAALEIDLADPANVPALFDHAEAAFGHVDVLVNNAAPGPTQTGYITPEAEARLIQHIPLGRLGEPEDIADVIVFLAGEQGRWLTGQKLYAGGGKRLPL